MSIAPVMQKCLCGVRYISRDKRDGGRCSACRKRRDSKSHKAGFTLVVVHDPGPGAFRRGARLEQYSVRNMLESRAFNPGTRVENMRGDVYEYDGSKFVAMEAE